MRRPTPLGDLIARHHAGILGYLTRLLGNEHDAQDASQETFLRAHRAFARLRPDSNPRAWLYRIATNCGVDAAHRRARATGVTPHPVETTVSQAPEARDQLRLVVRTVLALPPRQRAALLLRRFEGLDYAEIGAVIGGSAEAARANVYQAMRKLRAALGDTP